MFDLIGHEYHSNMLFRLLLYSLPLLCFRTHGTKTLNSSKNGTKDEFTSYNDDARPSLAYPTALSCLFIFSTVLMGVVVRTVMLRTSMCIPYRVVMFSIGGLMGFCANKYPELKPLVAVCYTDVDILLLMFLPIYIFYTSYSVDAHSFWRSGLQIALVGVPGMMMTAVMVTFIAYYLFESSWDLGTCFLFGVVCSPIYPLEVVKRLRELSKSKYISVLLLGEGLVGDATVMMEFIAAYGVMAMALDTASQISLLILRYAGGGVLLGALMGKIVSTLVSLTYYDLLCTATVTLSGAYLTYYVGEKYLYVSGVLATIVTGVLVSRRKSTVAGEVEQVMSQFWGILAHSANTLLFTMVGVVIFEKVSYVITVRQVALIFVTYTTVYCSRLMIYLAMTPVLRHVGYGMGWHHSMACVWGGLRGPLSLCLALIVLHTPALSRAGEVFIIQTTGLVMLSLVINATTMQRLLKMLGLAEISLAKKANMTNCVRRIMSTRDRCISMLKMDKFLADANWDLVQSGTDRMDSIE